MKKDRREFGLCRSVVLLAVCGFLSWPAAAEDTVLSVGLGVRSDDLQWSIAGTLSGTSPNILSELTWRNIDMLQLEVSAEGEVARNWILGADFAYGVAFDGEVQDSDYLGDNRTLEFSRSLSDAGESYAMDFGIRVGYVIGGGGNSVSGGVSIMPLLGFAHKEMNMKMTDGVQVLSDFGFPAPLGPFPGLNSRYDGEWDSVWLGARFGIGLASGNQIFLELQRHSADYAADANWNLRTDFQHPVSFEHDTNADGNVVIFAWQSTDKTGNGWEIKLRVEEWDSGIGTDTVYFSDGTIGRTQLNGVTAESASIVFRKTWVF